MPEHEQEIVKKSTMLQSDYSRKRAAESEEINILKKHVSELQADADFKKNLVSNPDFAKEVFKTLNLQDVSSIDDEIEKELQDLPEKEVKIVRAISEKVSKGIIAPIQAKINKLEALEAAREAQYNKETFQLLMQKPKAQEILPIMDAIAKKLNIDLKAIKESDPISFRDSVNELYDIATSKSSVTDIQADAIKKMQKRTQNAINESSRNSRRTEPETPTQERPKTIQDAFKLALKQHNIT